MSLKRHKTIWELRDSRQRLSILPNSSRSLGARCNLSLNTVSLKSRTQGQIVVVFYLNNL